MIRFVWSPVTIVESVLILNSSCELLLRDLLNRRFADRKN
jgi:hypothetical protein